MQGLSEDDARSMKARCDAATPGPWRSWIEGRDHQDVGVEALACETSRKARCRGRLKEKKEPSGVFYHWKGGRPLHPNAPQLYGMGEIRVESADRASGAT